MADATTALVPPPPASRVAIWGWRLFELLVLALLATYTLHQVPLALLLLDTTTVGGDTPAHNYLASQLHDQLFEHGRLVGWAPGWWAGFPAFQYYFCLPYLLIALLSAVLPFNVAFKLVSMAGVLALPGCAYGAMRLMRLPRPIPILVAIAMLPFLFTQAHTMWGVNLFSTMAGMLANSLSFPIMILTLGLAIRDAVDGRARPVTAVVGALLLASHFFTSIMAALTLIWLPLLLPPGRRLVALRTLAQTGALSGLLMAWWILPLRATRAYSVDFGTNWDVDLASTLPAYSLALIPFLLVGLIAARNGRHPAIPLTAAMAVLSALLFTCGYSLSPVFVNVRLWPFLWWALLTLGAAGIGFAIRERRGRPWLVLALLAAALLHVEGNERHPREGLARVRDWASFNYRGLEHRPGYEAFRRLIDPLDGTPGRLAGDLHEANNAMGSSRILELVPHRINKAVLEGGIVNSALSSYFVYATQCETSESCAGYPTLVEPPGTDLDVGTRHLELFNVKHFLARAPAIQAALRKDPRWTHVRGADEWELFELDTHAGELVTIPARHPLVLNSPTWARDSLEWFYRPALLDQPVVFLQPDQDPPPDMAPVITPAAYRRLLATTPPQRSDLESWLLLGPFPLDDDDPIPADEIDPQEGDRLGLRRWTPLSTRSPIFPGRFLNRTEFITLYAFANIFAPTAREARVHLASDDGATLWLNDMQVLHNPSNTGLHGAQSAAVRLNAGRNRLLLRSTQMQGAHFFQVRLTGPDGQPMPDVRSGLEREPPPESVARASATTPGRVVMKEVTANRIRFTTDALGQPHLIKASYFPNWKVRGARAVYLATPSFMLVYPEQHDVELVFGRTGVDYAGMGLSTLGFVMLLGQGCRRRPDRRSQSRKGQATVHHDHLTR